MTELLPKFSEIVDNHEEVLDNFLFGNGFSRCFLGGFSYEGLYDYAVKLMSEEDKKLFELLHTRNFEQVLNLLDTSVFFNAVFKLVSTDLQNGYIRIKNSLITGLKEMHPAQSDLDIDKLAWSLAPFRDNIFTTNYDLLGYWGLLSLHKLGREVSDGFGEDGSGNIIFRSNYKGLRLYFLHGALHLFQDEYLKSLRKVTAHMNYLLNAIQQYYEANNFPLFISKGDWGTKLDVVNNNKYLLQCLRSLENLKNNGMTIFGQALSIRQDQHIINAINNSDVSTIAYGIHIPKEMPVEKAKWKITEIECQIHDTIKDDKELLFFDSKTFFDYTKRVAWEKVDSSHPDQSEFPSVRIYS